MRLLKAEVLKLRTVRTTWLMLGIGLLIEGLFAGLYVGLVSLDDVGPIREVQTGTGLLMVMVLVLGVLAITTEFRHGTASTTFLAAPRRYPVMAAKLGAAIAAGVAAGLLYVAVNGGLALPLFESREGTLPSSGDIASVYAGVVASFAILCAFGLGVGAIVRNQARSSLRSPSSSSSRRCRNCSPATSASTSPRRRSAPCMPCRKRPKRVSDRSLAGSCSRPGRPPSS